MKYIKTYEKKQKETILYKNVDFEIELSDNTLLFGGKWLASSTAIFVMANLIQENSKHLNDTNLRNIPLREVDKEYVLKMLELEPEKLRNIEDYRSGQIQHFLGKDLSKSLPKFIYIDLTIEYYPLIKDAIINSGTMGDIIDNFKIIYKKIHNEDFELRKTVNKYNL